MLRVAMADALQHDDRDPLVTEGNPVRWRALAPLAIGMAIGVALMGSGISPRWMVPLGGLASLAVTAAALDFLGAFDDEAASVTPARALAGPMGLLVGAAALVAVLLREAVAGRLPVAGSALGIPAAFLLAVVAVFGVLSRLGPLARDEEGQPRPLGRRHGFWLVTLATALYLPMLGNHGLIDPWETHYGEVAREILARNDWISLWWAHDAQTGGWFWSKPALSMWLQAAAMAVLGVRYEPGAMMTAASTGLSPQPEWAVRFPVFLLTVVGIYLFYRGVARAVGRRGAFFGGLALLTMPQFFFVAHQTMTDMPMVASIAAAVGLFCWAAHTPEAMRTTTHALGFGAARVRMSLFGVVVGAVLLVAVPQILYLLARNVALSLAPFELAVVADRFTSGSPGNCGLPGNAHCVEGWAPAVDRLAPAIQAFGWMQVLALALWLSWGERRVKRLLYLAAWLCAAVATMAKGPAGVVLPVLAALAYVAGTGRWRELSRMEISAGFLVFAVTALPWFVAMYARHGAGFVDRLLFHDMIERTFGHVHDTNKGVDTGFRYYLWQLGYACFPWVGLSPIALSRGIWPGPTRSRGALLLLGGWFFAGFALFTFMGTKFHHYCLPIVPPLAMATGLFIDHFLRRDDDPMLGVAAIGAALVTLLIGRDLAFDHPGRHGQIRLLHLFTYKYNRPWPEDLDFTASLWIFAVAAALTMLFMAARRLRVHATLMLSTVAVVFCAWGLDVYFVRVSPHWGQRELVLEYQRRSREEPGAIVAYQLNWKGENFYLGNHVPAFVTSGAPFEAYVAELRQAGATTLYFITEHHRTGPLRVELGHPIRFEKLTDEALNNKFVLVRASFLPR
jgi:4-amino-4-deoxy-L-arabinose transferase-like glycosyltransferase